jgi:hypothetical protein
VAEIYLRVPLYVTIDTGKDDPTMDQILDALQLAVHPLGWDEEDAVGIAGMAIEWDEAVRVRKSVAEGSGGPPPCRHGQRVTICLRDPQGNLVEEKTCCVNQAADMAASYVTLHGGDPEERGRGAQPGSITFTPAAPGKPR